MDAVLNEPEFIDIPEYQLLNSGEMDSVEANEDVDCISDPTVLFPGVGVLLASQHTVNKSPWASMQYSLDSSFLEYKKWYTWRQLKKKAIEMMLRHRNRKINGMILLHQNRFYSRLNLAFE
jgi:hypothetical protein